MIDAPPEIRGQATGAHKVERLAYIRDRLAEGRTQSQIAASLGISREAVSRIVHRYGFMQSATVPVAPMGRLVEAFEAAPISTRHAVMRLADRHKTTIADAAMILAGKGAQNG